MYIEFLEFFLYWFYMFSLYYFIFQKLIWKAISVYFLWFHYWILKEWKAAEVQNHSVSAYQLFTQLIFSVKFLNTYKPRTGMPTPFGILWKWTSKPTKLAGDGKCRLTRFHRIRKFLANEIYQFSRLSHQTGCLFTWTAHSINQLLIQSLFIVPECHSA